MISAGGALGGLFVSLVAPRLFSTFAEWRLGLVLGCMLAVWVLFEGQPQSFIRRRFAVLAPAILAAYLGLNWLPQFQAARRHDLDVHARNFYGVISVLERNADRPAEHTFNFYSGRIVHGLQFAEPAKRREPTAYFGRTTGVGQTFTSLASQPKLRVGIIGLGDRHDGRLCPAGATLPLLRVELRRVRFCRALFHLSERLSRYVRRRAGRRAAIVGT